MHLSSMDPNKSLDKRYKKVNNDLTIVINYIGQKASWQEMMAYEG